MDQDIPFQYQISLLKLFGYQFNYEDNWRGYLLHAWGYCVWVCLAIGAITGTHCVLTNLNNVVVFTEATAYTASLIMCFIRVTAFFTQRQRIKKLYEDLMSMTEIGQFSGNI
jgi:hypothetical protein